MARPVYSSQFVVYTPSTPNESFQVPAGFTADVRQGIITQDIGGYDWNLYFQNSPEAPACFFSAITDIGINNSASWQGRVIVPEGGIIAMQVSTVGSGCWGYVGGYLFTNDPS